MYLVGDVVCFLGGFSRSSGRIYQLAGFLAFYWSWWFFETYTILISMSLSIFLTLRDLKCIMDVYLPDESS